MTSVTLSEPAEAGTIQGKGTAVVASAVRVSKKVPVVRRPRWDDRRDIAEFLYSAKNYLESRNQDPRKYFEGLQKMVCIPYKGTPSKEVSDFWYHTGIIRRRESRCGCYRRCYQATSIQALCTVLAQNLQQLCCREG